MHFLQKRPLIVLLTLIQCSLIGISKEQEDLCPYVDFYTSMNTDHKFNIKITEKNQIWLKIKSQYETYFGDSIMLSEEPRIPKIIHQIWMGGPLPEKYKSFQKTWIEKHPDWEYKLWTDEDLALLPMHNRELFDATTNYGPKGDIARHEILYQFGGLYVDMDFECLQPFDIFHHCCDFYAGCDSSMSLIVFPGLVGVTPHHPLIERCVKTFQKPSHGKETSMQMYIRTGPPHFTKCVTAELINSDTPWIIFPVSYFYPWPHYRRNQNKPEQIQAWIRPETFAIHHWHVSWNEGKPPGQ